MSDRPGGRCEVGDLALIDLRVVPRPGDRQRSGGRGTSGQHVRNTVGLAAGKPACDHGVGVGEQCLDDQGAAGDHDHDETVDVPTNAPDDVELLGWHRQVGPVASALDVPSRVLRV